MIFTVLGLMFAVLGGALVVVVWAIGDGAATRRTTSRT